MRITQQMPFEYVWLISTYNNRRLLDIEQRPTWAAGLEYYLYNLSLVHVILGEKARDPHRLAAALASAAPRRALRQTPRR